MGFMLILFLSQSQTPHPQRTRISTYVEFGNGKADWFKHRGEETHFYEERKPHKTFRQNRAPAAAVSQGLSIVLLVCLFVCFFCLFVCLLEGVVLPFLFEKNLWMLCCFPPRIDLLRQILLES